MQQISRVNLQKKKHGQSVSYILFSTYDAIKNCDLGTIDTKSLYFKSRCVITLGFGSHSSNKLNKTDEAAQQYSYILEGLSAA